MDNLKLKRLSPSKREWHRRHVLRRQSYKRHRRLVLRLSRAQRESLRKQYEARLSFRPPRKSKEIPLEVPSCLSLTKNFAATQELVAELRDLVFCRRDRVILHFDHVNELEAAATLLLASEIQRCINLSGRQQFETVNGTWPDDPAAFLQLREMGFYRLLRVPDPRKIPTKEDAPAGRRIFLPFMTFNRVVPESAERILGGIVADAVPMDAVTQGRIAGAIVEAINNACEHAYKLPDNLPRMKNRWWLGGAIDPEKKEFMILLLDQGVGIPTTLNGSVDRNVVDEVKRILSLNLLKPTEGDMIALATELHRSSTGLQGRGKGFQTMKKAVDSCDDGELWVLSNRGSYRYNGQGDPVIDNNPKSIGATLVQWRVRHSSSVMKFGI